MRELGGRRVARSLAPLLCAAVTFGVGCNAIVGTIEDRSSGGGDASTSGNDASGGRPGADSSSSGGPDSSSSGGPDSSSSSSGGFDSSSSGGPDSSSGAEDGSAGSGDADSAGGGHADSGADSSGIFEGGSGSDAQADSATVDAGFGADSGPEAGTEGGQSDAVAVDGPAETGGNCVTTGTGLVGKPGCPCSGAGTLACYGNAQSVTLVCSSGAWTISQTCPAGQLCDSTSGQCANVVPACQGATAGQDVCSSASTVVQCGVDLVSAPDVATCTNQTCVAGVCTGVCAAGATQCADPSHVQTCTSSGTWGGATACSASTTCVGNACGGECGPGQTTCNGNTPQTCSNGSWVAGTPCSGSTACNDGSCVTGVSLWGDFYPSLTCEQFTVGCKGTPLTNYCFTVQGQSYALAAVTSCTDGANGITFQFNQQLSNCTYPMNLFPPSGGGNPYDPNQLSALANLLGYTTATPTTASDSTNWPACATGFSDYEYIGASNNVAGVYMTPMTGSTFTAITAITFSH